MEANTFVYNLTNSKKSVILNKNCEQGKVFKYIGGNSIVYKNILVQNENNLDYYGKISENGKTLQLDSKKIKLNAEEDVNIIGKSLFDGDTQINGSLTITNNNNIVFSNNNVALGSESDILNTQFAVAIGYRTNPGNQSINIGALAGFSGNGEDCIAIGRRAGNTGQNNYGIAIGYYAGSNNQGLNAIAIGERAGANNQGNNSIAIGNRAGRNNQSSNSIILNASGNDLDRNISNAFFLAPVRNKIGNSLLQYDTLNNEISYSNSITGSININGKLGLGISNPSHILDINSDSFRLRNKKTIINSNDIGTQGEICYDDNYLYICIGTNTWKRFNFSNW